MPDFLTNNKGMFKSKTTHDPDLPNIKEALTGPHREQFIEGMTAEVEELAKHGTWEVIRRSKKKPTVDKNGKK